MVYANTTTTQIEAAVRAMTTSVIGLDGNTVQMAALALAILLQKPSIDLTTLIEVVKGASEYIHLRITPTTGSVN